ncbi:MAG TPA: DUF1059 domain-containing protein [Candidatus Acidoferrales bacterium]|jgi:predicted small metal-binding protein|nr:DUF1059 domain-containing protein [Candidatus Acidoferrales bacterium]
MQNAAKKMIDCSEIPTERSCTLTITGDEEEVLNAAIQHAVTVHGFRQTPELRERLRSLLKDEAEAKLVNL